MELTEKQKKFEYRTERDLYEHRAPCDPAEWNKVLGEIGGQDEFGDNRLRLVWGGTQKKNGYKQTANGSQEAQVLSYKDIISERKILKGYEYKNDQNKVVFVNRADDAPSGVIVSAVYEYLEFGLLRWVLERKYTVQELVEEQMRPDPLTEEGRNYGRKQMMRTIAPTNPRGEYFRIRALETPDGLYCEPTEQWYDLVRKAEFESRNATKSDKADWLAEKLAEEETKEIKRAEYEAEQQEILAEEILKEFDNAPQERVFFS